MSTKTENTNETTSLSVVDSTALVEMFGEKINTPAILMFDSKSMITPQEAINLAAGENVSLSSVINKELTLKGVGAALLDYVDEETGEVKSYIRYILLTNEGNFTTTSTFIGRTVRMLVQVKMGEPKIVFKQIVS